MPNNNNDILRSSVDGREAALSAAVLSQQATINAMKKHLNGEVLDRNETFIIDITLGGRSETKKT